jgi:hypothetical protein
LSARVALDQEVVTFGQRPQRARNAGMRGRLDQDLDDFLAKPPQPQRGFDVLAQASGEAPPISSMTGEDAAN